MEFEHLLDRFDLLYSSLWICCTSCRLQQIEVMESGPSRPHALASAAPRRTPCCASRQLVTSRGKRNLLLRPWINFQDAAVDTRVTHAFYINLWRWPPMTLIFSPRRARPIAYTHAKNQGQRSVGSKNRWTDGRDRSHYLSRKRAR